MIPSRSVFDEFANDYDRWFDDHGAVYEAQLRMLRGAVPFFGRGLEVGVGSGRFAVPFGIGYGIDPSHNLLKIAKMRGVEVVRGEAEHLPYRAGSFDYMLMMTVICFIDNVMEAFSEAHRLLKPGGILVVGFIEAGGEISQKYQNASIKGRFLKYAQFRITKEVDTFFKDAGFVKVSVIKKAQGFCVVNGRKQ
ncbi:MAG: class I SAM-dependent methyltransferase [Methanoregula sp.]